MIKPIVYPNMEAAHAATNLTLDECTEAARRQGVDLVVFVLARLDDATRANVGIRAVTSGSDIDLHLLGEVAYLHGSLLGELMEKPGAEANSLSMHCFSDGMKQHAAAFDPTVIGDKKEGE